jgi:hypothetical protein
MRSVHTAGSVQAQRARTSPPCVAVAGTFDGGSSVGVVIPLSIFLRPFAPPALPGFIATMDALTPVRWAPRCAGLGQCLPLSSVLSDFVANGHQTVPVRPAIPPRPGQVSWCHALGLLVVPSPSTWSARSSLSSFSIVQRDRLPQPSPGQRRHEVWGFAIGEQARRDSRPN